MARLTIDGASKNFGHHRALEPLSLDVADGEFLAVLGPSGCGKTTLLRVVAGFETIDQGSVAIDGQVVSTPGKHIPPEDRHVGIVFQSYALWPHMTVAENVAYGLKVARVNAGERRRRVDEALAVVGLTGLGERQPSMLSGGQRQRVALARCLVTEPRLILLDEPLANLDVHLRASMEAEFRDFHRRTGTTMFYITHDQAEAMALADRIAVLDRGVLMQAAVPAVLYREPATEMVARFIGQGMIVPVDLLQADGRGTCAVSLFGMTIEARCRIGEQRRGRVTMCLRPRDLSLREVAPALACRVRSLIYQGGFYLVEVAPEAQPEQVLVVEVAAPVTLAPDARVHLGIAPQSGWIIPEATGATP